MRPSTEKRRLFMKQWKGFAKWFLVCILAVAVIAPSSVVVAQMISPAGQVFTGLRFFIDGVEMDVEWNEAENSVFLTTPQGAVPPVLPPVVPEGGQPLMEVAPWFRIYEVTAFVRASINVRGEAFTNVMSYHFSIAGFPAGRSYHALNDRFAYFTGTLLRNDASGSGSLVFVRFVGDGQELASFTVNDGFGSQQFKVDVTGVVTLKIELNTIQGVGTPMIALYNTLLH